MHYANVSIATLLDRHPWAHVVLEWHGVDPNEIDLRMSLGTLCWLNRIDPIRLTRDLVAAHPDDAEDVSDLLFGAVNNNEQWEFDQRGYYAFEPYEVDDVVA